MLFAHRLLYFNRLRTFHKCIAWAAACLHLLIYSKDHNNSWIACVRNLHELNKRRIAYLAIVYCVYLEIPNSKRYTPRIVCFFMRELLPLRFRLCRFSREVPPKEPCIKRASLHDIPVPRYWHTRIPKTKEGRPI